MHPADIAEIAHELSPEERAAVFEALEDEIAADTLEEMHPSFQAALCWASCPTRRRRSCWQHEPDDAADLLADLPKRRASAAWR